MSERFYAVTRYAEVVEISRRPAGLLLGPGRDVDPRHARRGARVLRVVHQHGRPPPRPPARHRRPLVHARGSSQGVLDSVETICTEVIDGFCEQGEVDLVEVLSQPFPLLVICDMMGIPRSEFHTVLDATNVILGAGDPEFIGDRDRS